MRCARPLVRLATAVYGKVYNTTCGRARSRFKLRWFTPTTEVPLCGHGTLASAAALVLGAPSLCHTGRARPCALLRVRDGSPEVTQARATSRPHYALTPCGAAS